MRTPSAGDSKPIYANIFLETPPLRDQTVPSPSDVSILNVPPLIVTDPSAAIALFTHVTFNIPLLIVKSAVEAPFIPFFIFPKIIKVPEYSLS